jgi:hypothetical protein
VTFQKFAEATIIGAEIATRDAFGLVKAAHRAVFNYEPKPGFLYVRSRMISSRCNDNHDEFPADEIKASWKTAIGKPAFVNHHNETHKRMRGVIIDAAIHEDTLPDGRPDIWIEALHELDANRFPKLAESIIDKRVTRTSMGCDVGFSVCSACGNKASTPAEYCQHIPRMKGQLLYRHTASGKREGEVIREICHKLSFFENSFLVEPPADPTAVITGVDSRGLNKAAAKRGPGPGQGELFDLPPGAKKEPVPKPEKAKKPSDGFSLKDGPLSWDEIGERHPALYGDSEYHGEAARHSDGSGIGDAANMLAHDRADDPEAEGSSVHELSFHSEMVHPDHIDNASAGGSDPRVQEAERGYETNPSQVPPLVLVHRHGVYQVADGHHRAEAASRADKKVRAYVAYSPHPDEPFSDGGEAPYHGAEEHPGIAKHRPRMASLRKEARPDWMPEQGQNYHGTHCLICGEQAKYYVKPSQGQHGGKWFHHDSMKRDHLALPADPDSVINGIPGADAQRDQARAQMEQNLDRMGLPSLRKQRELRQMPPDPFKTGSLRTLAEVTALQQGQPFQIRTKGGKWLVVDGKGETRGEHDTEQDAKVHQATLYGSLPEAGDISGNRNPKSTPDTATEIVRARMSNRKTAYGEVKAPAEVDTLRTESCPVCGETDSFDGDRCEVCHFIQPPAMFTDPDTGVAKQMDLKKEPFDQGMVGPNGEVLPDVDTQEAMEQEAEGMPGTPGDQIADLFCPACGFSADTQAPMTNNDPAMASGQQGLMAGDVCPECGQATMLSPNDVGDMGGEVPQEIAGDSDADAIPDDQEVDADQDGMPDDGEPDIDGDGIPDDAEADENADGVPDDAEAAPEGLEETPEEEDANPAAVEDEEAPQNKRKDNSRRASWRGHERNNMTKPNQTAGASSELAALKRTVAVQAQQLAVAGRQLHYLAQLAGVAGEFDAIKREGAAKIADILNPAQPIPDPPGGAPTETTQQAEAPKTYDDPRNPGLTPGSTDGVPAQMTDSPLNPGVTLPTSPYTQLVDPTQPVAGTETQVPLDQVKIETDVRVGDPNNPESAFPLTGPFAADGAASAGGRTMASIRLAKLRKSAGLVSQDVDELVLGSQIERTATLSDAMIQHEITTLDAVTKSAGRVPAGRRPQGGPLPKTAGVERRVPSLAGGMDLSAQASVSSGFDDSDASDLFVDSLS